MRSSSDAIVSVAMRRALGQGQLLIAALPRATPTTMKVEEGHEDTAGLGPLASYLDLGGSSAKLSLLSTFQRFPNPTPLPHSDDAIDRANSSLAFSSRERNVTQHTVCQVCGRRRSAVYVAHQ